MAQLSSFTFTSLNGFYKGRNEDINWHPKEGEAAAYAQRSLQSGNTLLFGRVTYEMMRRFWPTPQAHATFPDVAAGINQAQKIVVSSTLRESDWEPTTILSDNWIAAIRKLKKTSPHDITLLGSGSLLRQLTTHRLIDSYEIMIDPVILASGQTLFDELPRDVALKLNDSQRFANGTVLLSYQPERR